MRCGTRWRRTLDDVLTRRTRAAPVRPRRPRVAAAPAVAELLAARARLGRRRDGPPTARLHRRLRASRPRAATPAARSPITLMTQPTPPIELLGTDRRLAEPAPLPDGVASALAAVCAVVTDIEPGGRGQPRLVAAGPALGAAGPGAAARRGGRPPHHHRAGGRRAAHLQRRRRAGHASRWPQRRGRRHHPGVRRRAARPHRAAGRRVGRRHVRAGGGARRHVRTRPGSRAARAARSHRRPLPAELRPGHGRRLGGAAAAPASTAPATARSSTWSPGWRSCWPTAASCAPAASLPARRAPTSPRCSSAAKARSASSPGCC